MPIMWFRRPASKPRSMGLALRCEGIVRLNNDSIALSID
jgi:hypothetical protein